LALGLGEGLGVAGEDEPGPWESTAARNRRKSSEPSPETGSQPGVAKKPWLQQMGPAVQWVAPSVMSWVTCGPQRYRKGPSSPIGGLPSRASSELARLTMAATEGAEAEVPSLTANRPPSTVTKWRPSTARSGKALPDRLKRPCDTGRACQGE